MSLRIDCALVCFLSADLDIMAEPERLARAGIFGCEADAALTAVRVDGSRAPCSFAPEAGDVRDALDAFVAAPPEPCNTCPIRATCRGGCRVVAGFHRTGVRSGYAFAFAPDPECPRVTAHRSVS